MKNLNRSLKSTINLFNSIIGVSILAMPLCFKQCGIVLSLLVIGFSVLLNQFSCYLLLKSAIINRRRNYELLAFDVFGSSGKTLVEVCILLFLLGTCIAFFVIVGDIGPSLVAHIFNIANGPHLRALIVTILAMFVIFPLGLLRNVENLTSFSMASLFVYLFLAARMISLALEKFFSSSPSVDIWQEVTYWDTSYVISYLPIFSMALSCQSQLFEIFHPDLFQAELRSLKYMMRSTKRAIYMSSLVYILIGFFGYIAFNDVSLSGNILQMLPSGFLTKLTLLLFLATLLTSFPLCLFPCRTSLHSLLFRKGGYSDVLSTAHSIHMSDHHFRLLTMVLIVVTMGISVFFPHVELVLALVGSTIGAIICFIIPALIFIKLNDKNTIEYLLAYIMIFFGMTILIFCTFSALHNISVARDVEIEEKINEIKKSTVPYMPPRTEAPDQKLSDAVTPEFKSRINNISKLKQSIKVDMSKLKKQEELLQRLEKQQQEHSKMLKEQREIINELKTHDQKFHGANESQKSESLPNKSSSINGSILVRITTNLPHTRKETLQEKGASLLEKSKVNLATDNASQVNRNERANAIPSVLDARVDPSAAKRLFNASPLKGKVQSPNKQTVNNVSTEASNKLLVGSNRSAIETHPQPDKSNLNQVNLTNGPMHTVGKNSTGQNADEPNTGKKLDKVERSRDRDPSL